MKPRNTAISIAVVAAVAGPFVLQTYNIKPKTDYWVPLSDDEKERIAAYLKSTNNCQILADRAARTENPQAITASSLCQLDIKHLKEGGVMYSYPSMPKYLALNALAMIVSFAVVFGLTFVLSALARR